MSKQNIFDNETFFEGYKNIRDREHNANIVYEIPALFSMMPDLCGKKVLDMGCGFGEHCKQFVESGAAKVVGIDISEKMLAVARTENADEKIEYANMSIEDIDGIDEKFDIVVSSLALHYVEDFPGVVKKVYNLLSPGGTFIFSQEHPLLTSKVAWIKDENGEKTGVHIANYGIEGLRELTWFVDGVQKYHRMFSTVINALAENGFIIEKVIEPLPSEEMLIQYPKYKSKLHKPDFLLFKARKGD